MFNRYKWEALTKIVISFNNTGNSWKALACVALFAVPTMGGIVTALIAFLK